MVSFICVHIIKLRFICQSYKNIEVPKLQIETRQNLIEGHAYTIKKAWLLYKVENTCLFQHYLEDKYHFYIF